MSATKYVRKTDGAQEAIAIEELAFQGPLPKLKKEMPGSDGKSQLTLPEANFKLLLSL